MSHLHEADVYLHII